MTRLQAEMERGYPDLRLTLEGHVVVFKGSFPLVHEGKTIDRFSIEIKIPPDFPDSIPLVFETAGKIPRTADWHTNEKGELCVLVPEEWLLHPLHDSVLEFMNGPLRSFLIGHSLAKLGLPRPFGERKHGLDGLAEAYEELLEVSGLKQVVKYLNYLSAKKIKGHWNCPCGSGMQIKKCHFNKFLELQAKIPRKISRSALDRLTKLTVKDRRQSPVA